MEAIIPFDMVLSIETLDDHEAAISRLENLMTKNPAAESFDEQELHNLAARIEEFEKRTFLLDLQRP